MRTLLALALAALPAVALPTLAAGDECCPPGTAKPSGHDVPVAELMAAIDAKTVTLIDCNSADDYAAGHLPGAISFVAHKDDLASQLPADKAALVVAYCGGPSCGAHKAGTKAAMALGYTNVKHFSGGLSGWKEANGTLETVTK
jgi:rhodanese-related sulfurtransferase